MIDKLQSVEEKFENINAQLCDPDIVSDIEKIPFADAGGEAPDARC